MINKRIFDYIVIGAGTAGGVIAKELSDDNRTEVLLLEPGTNMMQELSGASNAGSGVLASDNKYSFNVMTKAQPAIGGQLRIAGGRAIGGSSEHNAMYAVRGSSDFYDEWAKLVGPQWSYENLRQLFIDNETYIGATQNSEERGTNGPVFIRQQNIPPNGLTVTLATATSEVLGIPIVKDYNTGINDCTFYRSQFLSQEVNGKFVRSSTATGYLNENIVTQGNEFQPDEFGIGGRELIVLTKATVDKILFLRRRRINIAAGVEFVKDGSSQRAFARKGIIVSAGNFSSVILQRSGIGRSTDLARAGITTLVESPNVGHNFQAHFTAGIGIEVETSRLQQVISADPDQPFPLGAFQADVTGGRRLQLYGSVTPSFLPVPVVTINGWGFSPTKPTNIMSIGVFDLNPRTRGTIMVAHSDPEAYPSIDLNPLGDPNDLDFIIDYYLKIYKIMKKARNLDPEGIYRIVYPSENIFLIANDEEKRRQLAQYVRASYRNIQHFGGQCRMGRNIQEGVVDGFLNVFGTENLKVADLSISPILPDGNTTIPAQIIGLNAVRFLREDPCPYPLDDGEAENIIDS
ncbi:GMC family oxidoreductase [Desulfitobacterium sp. THU1]|uniref:GMC family oxidoreductase n=1 Tax=Desulfitobacterium sp. THU1 TaxID=3138072 RepID=UPI00312046DA